MTLQNYQAKVAATLDPAPPIEDVEERLIRLTLNSCIAAFGELKKEDDINLTEIEEIVERMTDEEVAELM